MARKNNEDGKLKFFFFLGEVICVFFSISKDAEKRKETEVMRKRKTFFLTEQGYIASENKNQITSETKKNEHKNSKKKKKACMEANGVGVRSIRYTKSKRRQQRPEVIGCKARSMVC
ncbi:hypothetical protein STCU_11247 [Strigomonas culicis]|uniref:Uncharacterized protein n=1 Tax=Strigomonas culicis TaxID=28005 RepID=S9THS6_9TRYP|nr:hypothetical protein STCU_11247 [Strigomonas culicis]|eukprot:EPY16454.1 hypothetical protein STCU_11247 [Strigomonas culicis]